jgi:hypothetical protein
MYDKEFAFAFVLSVQNLLLKEYAPFAWPVISLGLFFCTTKSKHNPSLSLLILLGKSKPIFEVDKLIGALQFQDFAIFQNFLRQKGSVSFDLVDKLDKILLGILFTSQLHTLYSFVFTIPVFDLLSIRNQRVIIGFKVSILIFISKPDKWPQFSQV